MREEALKAVIENELVSKDDLEQAIVNGILRKATTFGQLFELAKKTGCMKTLEAMELSQQKTAPRPEPRPEPEPEEEVVQVAKTVRGRIYAFLKKHPGAPKALIAKKIGTTENMVGFSLSRLKSEGLVENPGKGVWRAVA